MQHHGPHHCCGRRRSNAEFESLCSRFVEHASTCTTQPLRSMVSATSMRKRRRAGGFVRPQGAIQFAYLGLRTALR